MTRGREVRIARGALAVEPSRAALRVALSLACAAARPLVWESYRPRAGGLDEVDVQTVDLFRALFDAELEAGGLGDTSLRFRPRALKPGPLERAIDGREPLLPFLGAAALPAARSGRELELVLRGSTHAPAGASFETASSTWLHLMSDAGIDLDLELLRAGFAPRGGGSLRLRVRSRAAEARFAPLDLASERPLEAVRILSAAARLPTHVQQRQAARARSGIQIAGIEPNVQLLKLRAENAGSVVAVTGRFGGLPVTVSAVPARSRSAESAGEEAASEFRLLLATRSLVPPALVESVLSNLAFADGASRLATWRLPSEAATLVEIVRAFSGRDVSVEGKAGGPALVRIE